MESKFILEKINTEEIAQKIKERAQQATNEEELRIYFAEIINPILRDWGIKFAYEKRTQRYVVSGLRKDALYGTVILEFKAPGKLKNKKEFEKAKEQVKRYIATEAEKPEYYGRYFGVITDGFHIAFIRYRKETWEEQEEPLEVNSRTILKLLEAIRGLRRKPLDAHLLLEDFGPKSEITKKAIMTLYKSLINAKSPRTEMLFNDWKRVFSQVCAYSAEKLKDLIKYYKIDNKKDIDVEKLMFAIHTYYTILMKLLTSEIVTLFADSLIGSYLKRLEEAYLINQNEMLNELQELEEGGIFAELGIKNFLEADYFAWYLDEWNTEIAKTIYEIVKKLLDYEPATVELNPERVKDLFKRLYQNLVPRTIRHKLGEYFTPDWLAELVIEEVGYDGNPDKKVLDPACGSGTFLVLVIKKIKEYAEEHLINKRTLIKKIINNVQGIDLNPLAVLAAKANYIIALGDLIRYRPYKSREGIEEGIEIPIYLADSIAVGIRSTLIGQAMYLKTSEGEFLIPQEILEKGILPQILEDIEFCIKNNYTENDFNTYINKKYEISENTLESLTKLYRQLMNLEKEGKNRIWTRILKNSFAPLLIGKFDYVIGNPPWINWENLPENYRKETKNLWEDYRLTKKTKGMGLGKVKRDMAMLFVARCLDRFVKENGKLAFLIPYTVYKTQAGAGFREFLTKGYWKSEKEKSPCKVIKIHDLVTLYPFENAVNRTSLLILEKREQTTFPIPCIMWYNPRSKGIDQEAELEEVKKTTKQFELVFIPVDKNKPETPWMEITEKAYEGIKKVFGSSIYRAHAGVYTGLNQVYWIEILSEQSNGLLVTNSPLPGQKKKTKQVKTVIEKDLVYPLVRGRDVKKWYVSRDLGYIILPVDSNGRTLTHRELKINYPKTWEYCKNFMKDLVNRGGEPYKSKLKPYREKKFEIAEKQAPPFYWLFNVTPSLSPYKVAWKHVSGAITGKAEFSVSILKPIENEFLNKKVVIPDKSVMIVPLDNEEEAYYLSAILNSSIVSLYVSTIYLESHVHTDVASSLRIPPFNPQDVVHKKLSILAKKAHEIANKIFEEKRDDLKKDLKGIESEIDKLVAGLYGITDDELFEIKKCLMILKEGERPRESL